MTCSFRIDVWYRPGVCLLIYFVFQAEDGIRYLVRSRGLGDVYKRQGFNYVYYPASVAEDGDNFGNAILARWPISEPAKPVSYTHLTLPTSDLV